MNAIHIIGIRGSGRKLACSVGKFATSIVLLSQLSCTGGNPAVNGSLNFNSDGAVSDGRVGNSDGMDDKGVGGFGGRIGDVGIGGQGGNSGNGGSDTSVTDASDSIIRHDARPSDATIHDSNVPDAAPDDSARDSLPSDSIVVSDQGRADAIVTPDEGPDVSLVGDAGPVDSAPQDVSVVQPDVRILEDASPVDSAPQDASVSPDALVAGCAVDEDCEDAHAVCLEDVCVLAPVTCEEDQAGRGVTLRQGRWFELFMNVCDTTRKLFARCLGNTVVDVEEPCLENQHCEDLSMGELACVDDALDAGVADALVDAAARDAQADAAIVDARVPDARPVDAQVVDAAIDAARDAQVDVSVDATIDAVVDAAVVYDFCTAFDSAGARLGVSPASAELFDRYFLAIPQRFRTDHGSGNDPTYIAVIAMDSPSNMQFRAFMRTNEFGSFVRNGSIAALPYLLISDPTDAAINLPGHSAGVFAKVPIAAYITNGAQANAIAVADIEQALFTNSFGNGASWAEVAGLIQDRRTFQVLGMEQDQRVLGLFDTEVQLVRGSGLTRLPAILQFNKLTGACVVVEFPGGPIPTAQVLSDMRQGL